MIFCLVVSNKARPAITTTAAAVVLAPGLHLLLLLELVAASALTTRLSGSVRNVRKDISKEITRTAAPERRCLIRKPRPPRVTVVALPSHGADCSTRLLRNKSVNRLFENYLQPS
jgi:hypothetical protein